MMKSLSRVHPGTAVTGVRPSRPQQATNNSSAGQKRLSAVLSTFLRPWTVALRGPSPVRIRWRREKHTRRSGCGKFALELGGVRGILNEFICQ